MMRRPQSIHFFSFVTLALAACSIIYELNIAHTTALLGANTVFWYSLVVGLYLLGMGIGALLLRWYPKRWQTVGALVYLEVILAVSGLLSVCIVQALHMLFQYLNSYGFSLSGMVCFAAGPILTSLWVGVLTGLELPLIISLHESKLENSKTLLAVDYAGSLVGGLLFGLLLVPSYSTFSIALITGWVNLALALILTTRLTHFLRPTFAALLATVLFIEASAKSTIVGKFFVDKFYTAAFAQNLHELFSPDSIEVDVFTARSPYQRIDVVHHGSLPPEEDLFSAFTSKYESDRAFPKDYVLYLNGDFQSNTTHEEIYHEYFAHVPVLASGDVPKKVLVLGGGDGFLIRELLKYSEIESILHVDLDQELIRVALQHPVLAQVNQRSLEDPRVKNLYADGFNFIRGNKVKFDAIYIDFPVAVDYNLSRLYSREFFQFVGRSLSQRGYAVFDSTGTGLLSPILPGQEQQTVSGNDWPIYYNTLRAAGFSNIVPFITTLTRDEDVMRKISPPMVVLDSLMMYAETEEEQELAMSLSIKKQLDEFIMNVQQGFIMMSMNASALSSREWSISIPLFALDHERFLKSLEVEFPMEEEVNPAYVNSIFKPAFPNTPPWIPRNP